MARRYVLRCRCDTAGPASAAAFDYAFRRGILGETGVGEGFKRKAGELTSAASTVMRCDAAERATKHVRKRSANHCRAGAAASPPSSTGRSKARACTYLCCEDGIHAAAFGGDGGGEAVHDGDVVQRLAG
jgi:hypothetical protein